MNAYTAIVGSGDGAWLPVDIDEQDLLLLEEAANRREISVEETIRDAVHRAAMSIRAWEEPSNDA